MSPQLNKPIAGVVEAEHMASVIHRRCEDNGVIVTFDPYATTASTNGMNIIIPAIRHPVTQDKLDILYGYTIHECGHHTRPDAFKILNSAQPPTHLCAIYNIIEDDGMERQVAQKWAGDAKALSTMNNILIQRLAENWRPLFKKGQDAPEPEPLASSCIGQLSRLNWDEISGPEISKLIRDLPKNVVKLLNELIDEGWVDTFRDTKDAHDTWDVAVDLAKRLYPGNDVPEYEEIRKAGHEMQAQRSKKGNKLVEKEGNDEITEAQEGTVISWKDVVLSEHTEWEEQKGCAGNMGIDWTDYTGPDAGACFMPLHMINVVDMRQSKADPSRIGRYGRSGWEAYLPNSAEARQFGNQVRRYLQAQTRTKVRRHKRHGRLDPASIVKLMLPPIDGGEWNKQIFYQQDKGRDRDTAIFVLTDWSGSMNGAKMVSAADASQRLVYVMERNLRIPVALAAFSNGRSKCDIGYIKPFGTRGLTQEEIAKRFAKFYWYTSANNDADSLNWAYHQLKNRPEKRKILIVLSDGCPAGSWSGNGSNNLKYITHLIEQEGKIELYGVGIHSDAVKQYYTNYRILNNVDEINNTLFNLIKEGDHSGQRR